MKILIIQQKMIGDVLTTSILFEALKNENPEFELHYVLNSNTLPVVENNPFIDKCFVVNPEMQNKRSVFFRFLKSIRSEKYHAVIDVYSKFSSNLITKSSKAEIKISKHKWYTSYYYTDTIKELEVPKTKAGLAIENRLALLKPILHYIPQPIKPKIYLTLGESKKAKDFLVKAGLDLNNPIIMIGVLGSSKTKTYPLDFMAQIVDTIVQEIDAQILFNYIPKQKDDAERVYRLCKASTKKKIYFEIYGKELREFLAITSYCSALIGNEGGAVNMAKALGLATFTIFSPWIKKEAWTMFDDDKSNVSVHLKDFKPQIYEKTSLKEIKKSSSKYYELFNPNLILGKLKGFLSEF